MHESTQIRMSHVIYEWVMSHIHESCHVWMSHVTYAWVMSYMHESCHIWMSHVTYEWVMSMSHATYVWVMYKNFDSKLILSWVQSGILRIVAPLFLIQCTPETVGPRKTRIQVVRFDESLDHNNGGAGRFWSKVTRLPRFENRLEHENDHERKMPHRVGYSNIVLQFCSSAVALWKKTTDCRALLQKMTYIRISYAVQEIFVKAYFTHSRMYIVPCSLALGMCKNFWSQTYFGLVTLDSVGVVLCFWDLPFFQTLLLS